jgi:hypothetical protein
MPHLPASIVPILFAFAPLFTAPTWRHVQVLVTGTLLAHGPRTVAAALRVMGLAQEPRFERYHRVLSRGCWSGVQGSQILLGLLLALLPPGWPILVVVDETLERRKGARIAAKGMYRDAVRSSKSRVVTCLGLHWICMALIVPVPWSQRPWALPFLTLLAPSQRANVAAGKAHRTVIDWTVVMVRLVARGLTRRRWVLVGDGSYSCVRLGWECLSAQAALISRRRLDARLFAPPAPLPPGRRGPKPKQGHALAKLATRLEEARTQGTATLVDWYRGETKTLRLLSAVCLWHTPGWPPLPIRWVLVVDPLGRRDPQALFTTDLTLAPARVIGWFVWRWSIEVTFAEVRRHLGVETQRQWAAKAIARTTPVLLALFSIVCLMVHRLRDHWASLPRSTAWYLKPQATFSDCLALVRRTIWAEGNDVNSLADQDQVVISRPDWERVLAQLAATA